MKRIAAPMVGGMLSSTMLTLLVIPTIYSLWRQREVVAESEPEREVGRPVPIPQLV
jgi:Cu(I)/Ag(I) efflux system membrane protein CusA/SilA